MWSLGLVSVISGWGQWVGSLDVVSGWWLYCLPHNEGSLLLLCLCFLAAPSLLSVQFLCKLFSYFLCNFCTLFFILVFIPFLDFSNLIRERIILECFQHLTIHPRCSPGPVRRYFRNTMNNGPVVHQSILNFLTVYKMLMLLK